MDVGLVLVWLIGLGVGLLLMALWLRGRYRAASSSFTPG